VETLLIVPVQLAQPHGLPFRAIFEEHRRRRPDLLDKAVEVFQEPGSPAISREDVADFLQEKIAAQEVAYTSLARANDAIEAGSGSYTVAELDQLAHDCHQADNPLKRLLHLMDASALCLSGGGIRSASFSLGVLEGLSRFSRPEGLARERYPESLMDKLDYLSTVSGGGYIGSWMMSWVYRRMVGSRPAPPPPAMPQPPAAPPLPPEWKKAYSDVVCALAGHPPLTGGDPEPQPIRHLRSYTSFLAPALGLTLDTFTLAAIFLRNLLVNWTMLIPVLIAVIALTEYSGFQFLAASYRLSDHWGSPLATLLTALFLIAAFAAAAALPSHSGFNPSNRLGAWACRIVRSHPVGIFLLTLIAGCWLLIASSNPDHLRVKVAHDAQSAFETWLIALLAYGVVSYSIFLSFRLRIDRAAAAGRHFTINRWREQPVAAFMLGLAVLVCSAIASALLYFLHAKVFDFLLHPYTSSLKNHAFGGRLYIVFALPIVITVLLAATSLFCALIGIYEQEEDREWWARCGGCLLLFNFFWMLAHALAFYGQGSLYRLYAGAAGLVVGFAGSLLGSSGATAAAAGPAKTAQLGTVGKFLQQHNLVLPAIGGSALILIYIGIVAAEESMRQILAAWLHAHLARDFYFANSNVLSALILMAVSATLALLINWAININLFSLHGMYRMRLMRAFLGASNFFRRPDRFTNFDPRDTPYEVDLPGDPGAPLHVINTTLNLTGTRNTAWSQRKAESFTFSPIHAGSWRVGYVPAESYGGARGVTLATALAISGAAFNPNMGYQSSPLLSLLMTFFNVRLGCWLPNPKRGELGSSSKSRLADRGNDFLSKSGPSFALVPLVEEALGLANDTSNWIELTDGGHFENLGLYEMVMRRAKRIVVVDAGADPKCQFEDLGNAIRKIAIDLGIPIRFPDDLKMKAGMQAANSYCAVATIDYSCVDPLLPGQAKPIPGERDRRLGCLVYIKAGITGREPADILQYAMTHDTFPHETTANQFFNEAQFESYRHLGSFVVDTIARAAPNPQSPDQFETFVQAAWQHWSKPSGNASTEVPTTAPAAKPEGISPAPAAPPQSPSPPCAPLPPGPAES
jgi:hypothetical protein